MIASVPYPLLLLVLWLSCSSIHNPDVGILNQPDKPETIEAAVVGVAVSGVAHAYSFDVRLKSADTGCDQYADWWEVFDTSGHLLYRRILAHSHVNEQPFTRSGGPVSMAPEQIVFIRGHMNRAGYGTKAYTGSVTAGFKPVTLAQDYARALEKSEPQPTGCAF